MEKVEYALKEDPDTVALLQDGGRIYNEHCQISAFVRNLVRPEFFNQYMFFAPYYGDKRKYKGEATKLRMSIEDNGIVPTDNYVVSIDSEIEFRITPRTIQLLSRDYMPVWGMKSYLDYFRDRTSGILLLLRVYEVNQHLPSKYLEKGFKGSAQILKLYDENEEETSIEIDDLKPVISTNRFEYLKDEIIHMLKVEGAFISVYDSTPKGQKSLQERVDAFHQVQETNLWMGASRYQEGVGFDEKDGFDMAQLDYDSVFSEVIRLCPGMKQIIDYIRNIQAARIGEYDYYLKNVHEHNENESKSVLRIFDMSVRTAVRTALNYYKRNKSDLEDAFQEACIGILMAIRNHSDNVEGLFPSYSGMWMMQNMNRNLYPYEYNFRLPAHYQERINDALGKISKAEKDFDARKEDYSTIRQLLMRYSDLDESEARQMAGALYPAECIEDILDNPEAELEFSDDGTTIDSLVDRISGEDVNDSLSVLDERSRDIICRRFGMNNLKEESLDDLGKRHDITRERVRQIEKKALLKILRNLFVRHKISQEELHQGINYLNSPRQKHPNSKGDEE